MSRKRRTVSPARARQTIARGVPRLASTPPRQAVISPTLQLQRTLGNHRIAQLIQAKRLTPQGTILEPQQKLIVGAANDRHEQEADRVARLVMNAPSGVAPHSIQLAISPDEEKDRKLPTKRLPTSKTTRSDSFEAGSSIESQVSRSTGRGSPLPDHVRAYMEPRFGADFSHVRVHTGSDAIQMNRTVGAEAFTHGSDIYFSAGRGPANEELTAHELTHVVQQTGGAPLRTKKRVRGKSIQRRIGDGHDLTSPRFAGDVVLEGCFDNERLLRFGSKGDAVSKLQQALVDAGFPL